MVLDSQAPVAAIVNLILGISTLLLIHRSSNQIWNERLSAILIGWMLIFSGGVYLTEAIMESFQNPEYWDGGPSEGGDLKHDIPLFIMFSLNSLVACLMFIIPLFYPFPLLREENTIRKLFIAVGCFTILFPILMFFYGVQLSGFLSALSLSGFAIWLMVYIRFNRLEIAEGNPRHRSIAVASLLLIIGLFGSNMTWWLSELLLLNNDFVTRYTIGMETDSNILRFLNLSYLLVLGSVALVVLAFGETRRILSKGASGVTWLVGTIVVMGVVFAIADLLVLDITKSCYETACEDFPKWYLILFDIGSQTLHYLFRPILFMYVILNFNLVDVKAEKNSFTIKIVVVMMLLIVSSSITEMIQSVIPISQLVSAALMAMAIAAFIGWEEKLLDKVVKEGHSNSETLILDGMMDEKQVGKSEFTILNMSISGIGIFCLLSSVIFALMGVSG